MGYLDVERPSPYRIYDYLLGGSFNFRADRAFAKELLVRVPWARDVARRNRTFILRSVRFCVANGIRQFLDLGSGIPTVGRVDEVARNAHPDCRTVYVDSHEIAVAHAELVLSNVCQVDVVRADIRNVRQVLAAATGPGALLDPAKPIGVLMGAVVHFVPDADDPAGMVCRYREGVAPGSVLALTHATYEDVPAEVAAAAPMYRKSRDAGIDRSRLEIARFFQGWRLVDPGLVFTSEWRPEPDDEPFIDPGRSVFLAGVAEKPS